MDPLRSHQQVLYTDGVYVERDPGGWAFSWGETDVNSMIEHRYVLSHDQVIASGPPGRMAADALDALARELDRDPATLPWCRERRLLERIVADDVDAVRALLSADETKTLNIHWHREPLLTIALGVGAWSVAAELIVRGKPLEPPPETIWDAASYAIAALDDSDGALAVLQHLLARRELLPVGGRLRLARSPRIVHALIDAGADPNAIEPSSPTLGVFMEDATPLAVAVIHRDARGEDRLDVAAALLERGASLEGRDAGGRTPLIVAVEWGRAVPVRWLLDRGANMECAPDAGGRTPRSLALKRPGDASSRLLLEALGVS